MPVPAGTLPLDLQQYLSELERRVALLEGPQGFTPAFLVPAAALTTQTAQASGSRWGICTDLETVVWSDGAHWRRADTGAVIV